MTWTGPISAVALAEITTLFDHLVGGFEQGLWHGQAERLRGLEIDDEFELGRLYNRKLRGAFPLQHASGIEADLVPCLCPAGAVAYQPTSFDELPPFVHGRHGMARR